MLDWPEYLDIRQRYFGEKRTEARTNYRKYKEFQERKSMNCFDFDCKGCDKPRDKSTEAKLSINDFYKAKAALEAANVPEPYFYLAPLPTAVPCVECPPPCTAAPKFKWGCKKQEGKTPMRYNENNATAIVSTAKTDAAVQRDYFIGRLENARYPQCSKLEKLFNLHVDNTPKTFADAIAAIKAGDYTIDKNIQKRYDEFKDEGKLDNWYWGYQYGIVWNGPKPDYKGYEAALYDLEAQMNTARDTIMSGDAAAMKAAVETFEAWTPTVATTTAQ